MKYLPGLSSGFLNGFEQQPRIDPNIYWGINKVAYNTVVEFLLPEYLR